MAEVESQTAPTKSGRKDVGRPKTENTDQLVVRVPPELRGRLKALVPWLAPPGVSITMTDVVRAALLVGVDTLEAKRAAEGKKSRK